MARIQARLVRSVALVSLMVAAGSTFARPVIVDTIALTGTDGPLGPGLGANITFIGIGQQQPSINSYGRVAFRANPSNDGGPQGLWVHDGLSNNNIMLAGGARPGGGTYPAGTNSVVNSAQVNDNNDWAFRIGAGTGIFASSGGTAGRVALSGDVAPGTGNASYNATSGVASGTPFFNNAGQAGYIGSLAAGTGTPSVTISGATANAAGIWVGTPGNVSLALRQNDPINLIGDARVGTFQNLSFGMNGSGKYVVTASLQGTVVTGNGAGSNASMIASNRNGLFEVVARVGNAAPGYDGSPHATDLYRNFGTSGIGFNDAGKIAFSSSLRNAAGTQTATGALFTDVGGSLKMVARAGDPLPAIYSATGTALSEFAGVTWGTSYNSLAVNASNSLIFQAAGMGNTGGTNNTGAVLSMDSSGRFTKVQRNGDVAIVGGSPLGGDAFFLNTSNIAVNGSGQIAMNVTLTGAGVSVGIGNGSALFGWDPALGLQLIARTGDLFQVAPGDQRMVASIGGLVSSGGQDGRVRSLNDAGLLAFELDFADGSSGIFTATIPAPASLAPLALTALIARRRRR